MTGSEDIVSERPWSVDDVALTATSLTDTEARHAYRFCRFLAEKEAASPGLAAWWTGLADGLGAVLAGRLWEWHAFMHDPTGCPVGWDQAVASLPLLPPDDDPRVP